MIPISLYIHIPWCIRKCPYCDFNSHKSPELLPELDYVKALINDFEHDLKTIPKMVLSTIFIGGGTPSLFQAQTYKILFEKLQEHIQFAKDIEITLEANPGTAEQHRFSEYRQLGINRLSLGIQSFNPEHLKKLGRIHDDKQAHQAITMARKAGFDNINIDIMHSLPNQTIAQGLNDLQIALDYNPEHISWYQLTLEPNTLFYKYPPTLPIEDTIAELETSGIQLLQKNNYLRYEISAFSKEKYQSQHNLNYWLFGDYYGIGAGAHGKITDDNGCVYRTRKQKQPGNYLSKSVALVENKLLSTDDLIFEFMLNTTRLQQAIPDALFSQRTGLDFKILNEKLQKAIDKKLILKNATSWQVTDLGRQFTNDLQAIFL